MVHWVIMTLRRRDITRLIALLILIPLLWPIGYSRAARLFRGQAVEATLAAEGSAKVIIMLAETEPFSGLAASELGPVRRAVADLISDFEARWGFDRSGSPEAGGSSGLTVTARFKTAPAVAATINRAALGRLLETDVAIAVLPDLKLYPATSQGLALMGVNRIDGRYTGRGLVAAVTDTGVDYTHPALGGGGFPNEVVIGGYDLANDDSNPSDPFGHGTAVAGIIAGRPTDGFSGGAAPAAQLYALKISPDTSSTTEVSTLIKAYEWILDRLAEGDGPPVGAINTSFGGGYYPSACDEEEPALAVVVSQLTASGATVFASAGNQGYCRAVNLPACLSQVVAVGAVFDADLGRRAFRVADQSCLASSGGGLYYQDTAPDLPACYSNSHPTLVDILAPGHSAATIGLSGSLWPDFGGTSAAAAYASGAAVLAQQVALEKKDALLSSEEIVELFRATGPGLLDPKSDLVTPRIDLAAAVKKLSRRGPPDGWPVVVRPNRN